MQERPKRVRMEFVEIMSRRIQPMGKLRFFVLVSLCFVSACGQKGPLYLPVEEPLAVEAASHEQTDDTEEDEAVNE